MKKHLKQILQGKVVIVGIGNRLRGDDGVGSLLVERLKGNVGAVCIDTGASPENYTGKIVDESPDTILIVDAVSLGLKPGEYEILEKSDIIKSGLTTHDISPRMFIEYLENRTQAKIYMLGIQPKNLDFSDEFCDAVKRTLSCLERILKEAMHA